MNRSLSPLRAGLLVACLLLFGAATAWAQATIATDKQNYSPGELVTITGTAWAPGETVDLTIYHDTTGTVRASYQAHADAAGALLHAEFVIAPSDTNSWFLLRATGGSSGQVAETQFIDGPTVRSLDVGLLSPQPIYQGSSAACDLTAWGSWSWWWCLPSTIGLTVTGSLPPGVSASFGSTSLTPGGSNCSASTTLRFYTSSSTPAGTHTITVRAYNVDNLADYAEDTVTLQVLFNNHPPYANNDSYSTDENVALTVAAPGVLANDGDPDGDPITAYVYDYPDHGSLYLSTNGRFEYSPAHDWHGTDTFQYRVHDTHTAYSYPATVSITVRSVNEPPQASDGAFTGNEDGYLSGTLSFFDPDGTATAVIFDWPQHGSLSLQPNGAFSYHPNSNWNGIDSFRYRARDDEGMYSPLATVTLTILPVNDPPNVYPGYAWTDEDLPVSGALRIDEVDGDPYFATLSVQALHGTATVEPSGEWTYAPNLNWWGEDSFVVRVEDDHGAAGSGRVTVYVSPVNDPPSPAVNPLPVFVLECGNGTGVTPPLAIDPEDGEIQGQTTDPTTFSEVGSYGVHWTYTDVEGLTVAQDQEVQVVDTTPPHIVVPKRIQTSVDEGACTATVDFASQVEASDGCSAVTLVLDPPSGSSFPVGQTTVNCTATDSWGNTASRSFDVLVANPPPLAIIEGPASGAIFPVGAPVSLTGRILDCAGDTHTATWGVDEAKFAGIVDEATGQVQGTHVPSAAGVYLILLDVHDAGGGWSRASTVDGLEAMIVVYDPSAGFVTGGGWIQSPAGAYAADPSLAGKANFGFVSRYKRGATAPTGETEFQFKVADLNFHSTSYDWLVVAGARAQFKGRGTVNGAGDYGFLLTGVDGDRLGGDQPDRFRIKITDPATGTIVYDNQMGEIDSADPATVLGGGSILIHTGGTTLPSALDPIAAPLPTVHALGQNRPNPFRSGTGIDFDLPVEARVELAVYDAAGRQVARLLDEPRAPGRHHVEWTGRGDDGVMVRPGVYFYRYVARATSGEPAFTALRKMVFLR